MPARPTRDLAAAAVVTVRTLACLVAFACAGSLAAQSTASVPAVPSSLTPAQMREDLSAFRAQVFDRDQSYAAAARAQAETQLRRLEADVDRVTTVRFALALARIVALADNGHTNAAASGRARRFNRIPVRLMAFGDEFRVIRATEANADLLGARLVSVDGHAVSTLRDTARTLAGGVPHRRDRFAPFLFESPEQLNAMGLATSPARAIYAFQTLD